MRKTSLVHAKSHLSELVDLAEHRGQRTVILRHGKPAAAIVPVDVAAEAKTTLPRRKLTQAELAELWAQLDEPRRGGGLAILEAGRSRLDSVQRRR